MSSLRTTTIAAGAGAVAIAGAITLLTPLFHRLTETPPDVLPGSLTAAYAAGIPAWAQNGLTFLLPALPVPTPDAHAVLFKHDDILTSATISRASAGETGAALNSFVLQGNALPAFLDNAPTLRDDASYRALARSTEEELQTFVRTDALSTAELSLFDRLLAAFVLGDASNFALTEHQLLLSGISAADVSAPPLTPLLPGSALRVAGSMQSVLAQLSLQDRSLLESLFTNTLRSGDADSAGRMLAQTRAAAIRQSGSSVLTTFVVSLEDAPELAAAVPALLGSNVTHTSTTFDDRFPWQAVEQSPAPWEKSDVWKRTGNGAWYAIHNEDVLVLSNDPDIELLLLQNRWMPQTESTGSILLRAAVDSAALHSLLAAWQQGGMLLPPNGEVQQEFQFRLLERGIGAWEKL